MEGWFPLFSAATLAYLDALWKDSQLFVKYISIYIPVTTSKP